REISIRSALGAGPGRLVRELLAESVLLALFGCAVGLVLAAWALRILVGTGAARFKSFLDIGLDPLALGATVLVSLLCGLGFGLAPALMAARADLSVVLRQGGKGTTSGRQRARSVLIVAEIGLAVALLIGAGLMVRGFRTLRGSDLGFDARGLLTLRIYMAEEKYASEAAVRGLVRELSERLRSVPGVETFALEGPGMPTDDWFGADFALEDPPPDLQEENKTLLLLHHVTPGYFAALGIPLREGRDFGAVDNESGVPVVIVSEALARRAWPGGALGKGLRPFRDPEAPYARIVGVVADVQHRGLAPATVPAPDIYFPLLQRPAFSPPVLNFLVRPSAGVAPASLAPALRSAVREVASTLPVYDVDTLEERLDRQAAQPRFLALLMGLFAGVALLLAAIGLYGVTSNAVAEATRAIGVRMALGAARGDVLLWVVGRAALLALVGIALGVVASVALTRVLTSVLYGVSATDPLIFLGTALALLTVALAASAIPALRAIRVDPAVVLRSE
ncbi:MAG TPA: FtsX-like permease family protein, partial [Thermoanaerobaculia bacterium]|nr:FtsX-like permease family protein [Thermoanaerobaculia bacterium]